MSETARTFDKTARVAIVGAGRLGSSLAQAMTEAGYNVAAASSGSAEHRVWLADRLPGTEACERPEEAAAAADVVFITTPDDVIEEVCESITWRAGQAAVHCAGVLPLIPLRAAAEASAATGAFHPLQTFADRGSGHLFQGVTFAVEADDRGLGEWLSHLARSLGGETFGIAPEHRDAYHASAVMACGLMAGLVGLAAEMWEQFGQDRERGLEALLPLVRTTVAAIERNGIPGALTGPYVRGDVATVRRHLEALSRRSPGVARAYASLALAALPLAREQGGLTQGAESRMTRELRAALRALPRP